jgi:glycosidase
MKGRKPDELIREPFVWAEGKNEVMQTTWEKPTYSSDQTVIPLSKQKDDPESLYNFYKRFIHYRNSSEALTYGSIESSPLSVQELVSFIRKKGDEQLLIINNVSDVEITVRLENELSSFSKVDFISEGEAEIKNHVVVIPAYASLIVK